MYLQAVFCDGTSAFFGMEREVLVDELQYYFEQTAAAEIEEKDFAGARPTEF